MTTSYPEHDKLHEVKERSQAIGEFLDWVQDEYGAELLRPRGERSYVNVKPVKTLLAEFFDIDPVALEAEKQAMLDAIREAYTS